LLSPGEEKVALEVGRPDPSGVVPISDEEENLNLKGLSVDKQIWSSEGRNKELAYDGRAGRYVNGSNVSLYSREQLICLVYVSV
jgi:hypothetical protein